MPIKTTKTLSIIQSFKSSFSSLSSPTSPSTSTSSSSSSPKCPSTPHKSPKSPLYLHTTLSENMMQENISIADSVITNHAADHAPFFSDRPESLEFMKSIKNLQQSMLYFISSPHPNSHHDLFRAQTLMQTAMKRLEREFYHILATNRYSPDAETISDHTSIRSSALDYDYCDAGSSEEDSIQELQRVPSPWMFDLRSIAECMISSGYGKECVKIFRTVRKSVMEESLYTIGFERMTPHQMHKLDWETAEHKIKNWLNSSKAAVKTLFFGERSLCDHVFVASGSVKETAFAEITKEAAVDLFLFPESMARKCRKSPERIFPILDLCNTLSELMPDIESIFSYESTAAVRLQVTVALSKITDTARHMIRDFEMAMQKDTSREPAPGGGIHPLTREAMNYICSLAEYSRILSEIYINQPLQVQSPLPWMLVENSHAADTPSSMVSVRFAWLVLVLLCKLDGKSDLYKDVGLSYLFLANNLQYIITKTRHSSLHYILGYDWISTHEAKVQQYVFSYESTTWGKVLSTLTEDSMVKKDRDGAIVVARRFNQAFAAVYRAQTEWVVPDGKMREGIKASVKKKTVSSYRAFLGRYRGLLEPMNDGEIIATEQLENYLSDLFFASGVSDWTSSPLHAPLAGVEY